MSNEVKIQGGAEKTAMYVFLLPVAAALLTTIFYYHQIPIGKLIAIWAIALGGLYLMRKVNKKSIIPEWAMIIVFLVQIVVMAILIFKHV